MFGMMRNPAASYATVSVDVAIETANPHRLVLMLFDGAIAAIVVSKSQMAAGDIALKGSNISRAIDIVANGLKASLDMASGGELAERLAALYDYITQRLLWANLKNEPAALDEAMNLLKELREAWEQITPGQQEAA